MERARRRERAMGVGAGERDGGARWRRSAERWEEAERCFAQRAGARSESTSGRTRREGRVARIAGCTPRRCGTWIAALAIDPSDGAARALRGGGGGEGAKARARAERRGRRAARATAEDLDGLRARVLNPARGLDALSRPRGATKTYEMELGDDDDDDDDGDARRRRERKRKKERKKERKKRKKKREKKRSRRDDSSSSSSSS